MAHRFHVTLAVLMVVASLQWLVASVAEAQETKPVKMSRGRVIDAATGEGIPGAYVVARYETTYGVHNQSACPWTEAAKADEQGWFDLPVYDRYGVPILRAFSPGYVLARPKRTARAAIERGQQVWRIDILESDDGQDGRKIIGRESGVYKTWQDAGAASREWIDTYLRKVRPSQDDYLAELRLLSGHPNCGRTRNASTVHAFLDSVYAEELKVGAPKSNLDFLLEVKADVREDRQGPE